MDETYDEEMSEVNTWLQNQRSWKDALTPRRLGQQPPQQDDEDETNEGQAEAAGVSVATKKRLAKMGRIFDEEEELQSPLPPSRGREIIEKENLLPELRPPTTSKARVELDEMYIVERRKRLAGLAEEVKQREDEAEKKQDEQMEAALAAWSPSKKENAVKPPRKSVSAHASPKKPAPAVPRQPSTSSDDRMRAGECRKINWDPKIIDKLESQGFKKTASQTRLQYEFEEAQRREAEAAAAAASAFADVRKIAVEVPVTGPTKSEEPVLPGFKVSDMAKRFDSEEAVSAPPAPKVAPSKPHPALAPPKPIVAPKPAPQVISAPVPSPPQTPTEQAPEKKSVLEKMKVFEGRMDGPAAPKNVDPAGLTLGQKLKLFEKAQAEQAKAAQPPKPKSSSCLKPQVALVDPEPPAPKPIPGPPKPPRDMAVVAQQRPEPAEEPEAPSAGPNTVMAQKLLFENVEDGWRSNEIAKKTFEEKRKDMEVVLNRWQRPVEISVGEPRASVATENAQPGWQRTVHPHPKPVPTTGGIPPPPPPPPPPAAASGRSVSSAVVRQVVAAAGAPLRPQHHQPRPASPDIRQDPGYAAQGHGGQHEDVSDESQLDDTPTTEEFETAGEGDDFLAPNRPRVTDEAKQQQQWRVRFQEGRMYPSLDDFRSEVPPAHAGTSQRFDDGTESDTEMTESEASFAQPSTSRMVRHISYQMAVQRQEDGYTTEETTDTEACSEWERESVTSASTLTNLENELGGRRGLAARTDSDLTSLSSFDQEPMPHHSVKRAYDDACLDKNTKRVRLNDPRTAHLDLESPNQTSLKYTISTYRRQKPEGLGTPTNKTITYQYRAPAVEDSPPPDSPNTLRARTDLAKKTISLHMKELDFEAMTQLSIMHQTSNAVTVCASRHEFKLSSERIEAEKLLLVATKRHAAITEEIQRLKRELEKLEKDEAKLPSPTKGQVSLSGLSLHLKPEFIEYMCGEGAEFVHHFIVLIRHRENVIPSQLISLTSLQVVRHGCLVFDNVINIPDLDDDFSIQIEVHALQTKRESIDHDVKYHIKKQEKSKFSLTPKKTHHDKDSMKTPPTMGRGCASPSVIGPSAVGPAIRKLCFGLVGEALVTLATVKTNKLTLSKVPPLSPLSGILSLNIQCASQSSIEASGFLTVFEDVSGLGCWQRRWYVLKGSNLSYWKYPDQQTKNEVAMGSIDLSECINEEFRPLRRDLCARMNSFALVVSQPYQPNHHDGLTMFCRGERTVIRYMFAADTKEEMNVWCKQLKRALGDVRAWNPDAQPAQARTVEDLNGA